MRWLELRKEAVARGEGWTASEVIRVTWETRKTRVAGIALLVLWKDKAPWVELSLCRQARLALTVDERLIRLALAMMGMVRMVV